MLTLHSAARLLRETSGPPGLVALTAACGFPGQAAPLDKAARTALGLPESVRAARVTEGRGSLRALSLILATGTANRDVVATLTARVQRRAPFALWLVFAAERNGPTVSLSCAFSAPKTRVSLLMVDRGHVVDSDAETVRAIAATAGSLDVLVHSRWCELLGREALTHRFFRALEHTVDVMAASLPPAVPGDDRRTLALLTSTRMLFLAFLEAKGWLDGDHAFLRRTWDTCMENGGRFHRSVLLPLCFGTLNTPRPQRAPGARAFGRIPFLNGGLFNRTPIERRHARALFPDDALGVLVGDLLGRWRFTVREDSASHAEAAVDPEMLGRAFESLMASRERRASGTFYTPRVLVARVFDAGLSATLAKSPSLPTLEVLRGTAPLADGVAERCRAHLASLRILDPACGSGAFLVHALEELATLLVRCGDARDLGAIRRDILARQLFGVDREPTAVWLCELRLWLGVAVETIVGDPHSVPPLPNLDAQVRIGDALAGDAFATPVDVRRSHPLSKLRERYARSTGGRKRTLMRALARAERHAALAAVDARLHAVTAMRRDIVTAMRGRDLFGARIRPATTARARIADLRMRVRSLRASRRTLERGGAVAFDFAVQFADIGARGGFSLVIGNPPWVRLHRIPPAERAQLQSRFEVYRNAGWRAGAEAAGAGAGFAAQVDLAALFVERSLALTSADGAISLLVPAKLWRSLAGGGVRQLLSVKAHVVELEDWSEARATFDAAVYPSLLVATRTPPEPLPSIRVAEHHRDRALQWTVNRSELAFDDTPGAPWLWLPGDPRAGFDRVRSLGVPLSARQDLRPRLGVKCGCNDAFIVRANSDGSFIARDGRRGSVEPDLLRPLLRGQSVEQWRHAALAESIIFPHDRSLQPLDEVPPLARQWLLRWRTRLAARSDQRGRMPWWSVFRVDGADVRFPRVVWSDLARSPRATVLAAGDLTVPLNSCYVSIAPSSADAHALAAWLNSPISAAWLAALAEPARGGFRRLLGWTVSLLPLPRDWERAVRVLSPIGIRAAKGHPPAPSELLDASLEALGAAHHELEALLTWGHR